MFALGCILFEVTTGQKLFRDDWNIREYALRGEPIFPNLWPNCLPGGHLYNLGELAQALLDVDPFKRPGATETMVALQFIRQSKVLEFGKINASDGPSAQGPPPSPARKIAVAPRYQAAVSLEPSDPIEEYFKSASESLQYEKQDVRREFLGNSPYFGPPLLNTQVQQVGGPEGSYWPNVTPPISPRTLLVEMAGMTSETYNRRRVFPKESREKLRQWLSMHVEHPYPTLEEKRDLAAEAGITMEQVFSNISSVFRIADHVHADEAIGPFWTMPKSGPTGRGKSWSVGD